MVSQNDHPKQESDEGVSAMNKSLKLDKDELEILRDFERGELERHEEFQRRETQIRRGSTTHASKGQAHQYSSLLA